jgi:hypothetical protein
VPGWHPDPNNAGRALFWTGTTWAGERVWNGTAWVDPGQPAYRPAMPPPAGSWPAPSGSIPSAPPVAAAVTRTPVPRRLRNRAWLAIGGGALMVIGSILPWATQNYIVTTTTVNGTSVGGGQFSIVLALVIAAFAGLTLNGVIGAKKSGIVILLLGILAIAICIGNMSDISGVIDQEKSQSAGLISTGAGTKFGAGLLVLLIADIVVIISGLLTLFSRRRIANDQPVISPAV